MLIQTARQLAAFCETARKQSALFIDTEFVGEGRYYPDLGTIQVGIREQAVVIDPLALSDLSPLFVLLTDPAIEKVFHAATQDLAIFYRLIGQAVAPVFDTQIAAAMLGYDEQISFLNLVERATGTHLAKSHSFTDWLRRPLTPGQLDYALDDVRFLIPVYDYVVQELKKRDRLTWTRDEFLPLEDAARYRPADAHDLYLRIRGVERLRGKALGALRELVAWREEAARQQNLPTGRIARDEVLLELARHPRESVKELDDVRGLLPQQISRFGVGLISAAQRGSEKPSPRMNRQPSLPNNLEPTVDFLVLCLRSLAGEQEISAGLVATRSDLAELILHGDMADINLMRSWRREIIGEALLATLQGKATARILPDSRRVHLDWHEDCRFIGRC